jgi:hypothetical protein
MIRVTIKHSSVGELGVVILGEIRFAMMMLPYNRTYVFLLLVDVTYLKPNVFFS